MELRQIRYFLALSQTLNFTRAAEQCGVSQPSMTLSIKKLEEELGGELIHRQRSHTRLTQLGQMVLPFLEQVYQSSHAAQTVARELSDGRRAPLRLGVTDVFDKSRLLAPIRELEKATSGLELDVEGGGDAALAARLMAGDLDAALLEHSAVDEDHIRFAPIYTEEMRVLLCEDDPLAAQEAFALEDLVERPWIALADSRLQAELQEAARAVAPDWSPRHRAVRPMEAQFLVLS
ncbi:MAG: LysR family transcriptional regulator, partial [Rhodobacteraceae bacterium]|nr:LysR family transcriptional regulator [Paracoccaceae bacterium]